MRAEEAQELLPRRRVWPRLPRPMAPIAASIVPQGPAVAAAVGGVAAGVGGIIATVAGWSHLPEESRSRGGGCWPRVSLATALVS